MMQNEISDELVDERVVVEVDGGPVDGVGPRALPQAELGLRREEGARAAGRIDRGEDRRDVVPGRDQPHTEVANLRLDAADARRVAVRDHGDLHGIQAAMRKDGVR